MHAFSLPHMSLEDIRIVLVEPNHPGNIGAAARALKTMGLGQLALVRPQRFPDPQAEWRAAGAADVLKRCLVAESLEQALADCHWVAGASARRRRIPWPAGDVRAVAKEVVEQAARGPAAVLFGREASGLTNEELHRCHRHLRIPASPAYPSLNLAMAVQVVAYEIYRQAADPPPPPDWDRPPARVQEVEALLKRFEAQLTEAEFLDADNPKQTMTRLRRLLTRVQLDVTEVALLHGALTAFEQRWKGAPRKKTD